MRLHKKIHKVLSNSGKKHTHTHRMPKELLSTILRSYVYNFVRQFIVRIKKINGELQRNYYCIATGYACSLPTNCNYGCVFCLSARHYSSATKVVIASLIKLNLAHKMNICGIPQELLRY